MGAARRHLSQVVAAVAAAAALSAGCSSDGTSASAVGAGGPATTGTVETSTAGDGSAVRSAPRVDLAKRLGQTVDVTTHVVEVIDANNVIVSGGQLGPQRTLVAVGTPPLGLVAGRSVRIVGKAFQDTAAVSDPFWVELKSRPVVLAESMTLL